MLLILSDQQRADCWSVPPVSIPVPLPDTPALAGLAQDGVVFNNAFCTAPLCVPSRHSLLTGLHPSQHHGGVNGATIAPSLPTFPRVLRHAGYRTAAVGKMHFTPTHLDVGFDDLVLAEQDGDGRFEDQYHHDLAAAGLIDLIDLIDQRREFRDRAPQHYWDSFGAQPSNLPERWHSTTWIADRAIEQIKGWQSDANLLMVGFIKPHHPFDPPSPWDQRYSPDDIDPLPGWTPTIPAQDQSHPTGHPDAYFPNEHLTEETLRQIAAYYYATISHLDYHIGRILNTLRRRGLYDDTLIVFTSDHGEYLGFHHLLLKHNHMYDPLVRVPLLVKFPRNRRAGHVAADLTSLVDVAPTVLSAAGLDADPLMTGTDLGDETVARQHVFAESAEPKRWMVRSATHKLLLAEQEEDCLFFDLEDDPHELNNRYADPAFAPLVTEHRQALAHHLMWEATAPTHRDPHAPTIAAGNASGANAARRARMQAYFESRFHDEVRVDVPP